MQAEKIERTRRLVLESLESLQLAGVVAIPKKAIAAHGEGQPIELLQPAAAEPDLPKQEAIALSRRTENTAAVTPLKKTPAWQPGPPDSLFDANSSTPSKSALRETLPVIEQEVAACTRCEELARTRKQTVFGVGNPSARLCFLGEAPGADEDRLGEPFVGRAGQLLTKIIEACRLKREDVYIVNMIKCRPPGNRNPLPDELTNCRGFLDRQFDLIRPEFICCLGAVAAQNLLGTTLSIGKLRGKVHNYRGAKVVCTYHPAFLLRSPSFKKETWEDMKLLFCEMGVELG